MVAILLIKKIIYTLITHGMIGLIKKIGPHHALKKALYHAIRQGCCSVAMPYNMSSKDRHTKKKK